MQHPKWNESIETYPSADVSKMNEFISINEDKYSYDDLKSFMERRRVIADKMHALDFKEKAKEKAVLRLSTLVKEEIDKMRKDLHCLCDMREWCPSCYEFSLHYHDKVILAKQEAMKRMPEDLKCYL